MFAFSFHKSFCIILHIDNSFAHYIAYISPPPWTLTSNFNVTQFFTCRLSRWKYTDPKCLTPLHCAFRMGISILYSYSSKTLVRIYRFDHNSKNQYSMRRGTGIMGILQIIYDGKRNQEPTKKRRNYRMRLRKVVLCWCYPKVCTRRSRCKHKKSERAYGIDTGGYKSLILLVILYSPMQFVDRYMPTLRPTGDSNKINCNKPSETDDSCIWY